MFFGLSNPNHKTPQVFYNSTNSSISYFSYYVNIVYIFYTNFIYGNFCTNKVLD